MRSVHLAIIASAFAVPLPCAAQSGNAAANTTADAEDADQMVADEPAATNEVQPAPVKKGGLLGKAKGLAKNKVVKAVAKTAACTMLPGGQVIAGAIDAASSKSAGEAAKGAAGAATGSNCMPGGLGAPGLGGGVAGAAAQAVTGQAAGGASLAGLTPGMPLGGGGYGSLPGIPSPEKFAACLGLTAKEFQELSDPTHGQPRAMTDDEMQRQAELAQKVDMQRYQACIMQH
jgi:hypothetical protein